MYRQMLRRRPLGTSTGRLAGPLRRLRWLLPYKQMGGGDILFLDKKITINKNNNNYPLSVGIYT